jgi:hypothetical protein
MDYVKFVYRPLAARAARQALVGRNRAQRSPDRGRFTLSTQSGPGADIRQSKLLARKQALLMS